MTRKPAASKASPGARTPAPKRKPKSLQDFCRSLPGATEDIKWGDHLVFSVGGKIFAGFGHDGEDLPGFKCDDDDFDRLTGIDGIIPAPYAARFGWVKIQDRSALPDDEVRALLRKSYDLVLAKLPARVRQQIAGEQSKAVPGTTLTKGARR